MDFLGLLVVEILRNVRGTHFALNKRVYVLVSVDIRRLRITQSAKVLGFRLCRQF